MHAQQDNKHKESEGKVKEMILLQQKVYDL
jgi:hypothetical protein